LFLVLHASGLTLIPISVIAPRAIMKSNDPTLIFIPCMIATFVATITGLIAVAIRQKINLFNRVIISWIGGISIVIALLVYFLRKHPGQIDVFSKLVSNGLILLLFIVFITGGLIKKVNVYDAFIEGAKGGFDVAVKIIPFLVGMLVAISVLRTCGVFDYIIQGFDWIFSHLGMDTEFVKALPTALMRPLSGSASRAMMIDTMNHYGADSFPALLSGVMQGSSDTTFYIVALYFGSVGIRKTRYAVPAALLADLAGVITAILISYFFFHHTT